MKPFAFAVPQFNDDIDNLSAELTAVVYSIALRDIPPQKSWLEFELDLWRAIKNRLVASEHERITNAKCHTASSDHKLT